mgnify:CR=1 FL=1
MKEIEEKIKLSRDQNNKFQDEINELRKDIEKKSIQQNDAMTEGPSQKQGETISVFESSTVKLQEDLQKAKTASDASHDENNKLQDEINELKKEIEKNTIQENHATKTSPLRETNRALQSSIHKLQKELQEVKRAYNQLRNDNEKRKKEIGALQRQVAKLTDKFVSENKTNKLLKKTVRKQQQREKRLKDMETKLALGQVAWCLEKEIWKAVLPNIKMGKTAMIFKSMKQWLLENSSSTQGQEAIERWEDLQDELKWEEGIHKFGLKLLKEVRNEVAHPEELDVEGLEEARKELKDYIADPYQKRCEEIIDMVIKVKKLNSSKSA